MSLVRIPYLSTLCEDRIIANLSYESCHEVGWQTDPKTIKNTWLPDLIARRLIKKAHRICHSHLPAYYFLRRLASASVVHIKDRPIDSLLFEALKDTACRRAIFDSEKLVRADFSTLPGTLRSLEFAKQSRHSRKGDVDIIIKAEPNLEELNLGPITLEQLPDLSALKALNLFSMEYSLFSSGVGGRHLGSSELAHFLKTLPMGTEVLSLQSSPAWVASYPVNSQKKLSIDPCSLPNLRSLCLEQYREGNDQQWSSLLAAAPKLEVLEIAGTGTHFTGKALLDNPNTLKQLWRLRLDCDDRPTGPIPAADYHEGFVGIPEPVLFEILHHCKKLKKLELAVPLRESQASSAPGIQLPSLRELTLSGGRYPWKWDRLAKLIGASPYLCHLHLQNFELTPDDWMKLLEYLRDKTHNFCVTLELSNCTGWTHDTLYTLSQVWPDLKELALHRMDLSDGRGDRFKFKQPVNLHLDEVTGASGTLLSGFAEAGISQLKLSVQQLPELPLDEPELWTSLEVFELLQEGLHFNYQFPLMPFLKLAPHLKQLTLDTGFLTVDLKEFPETLRSLEKLAFRGDTYIRDVRSLRKLLQHLSQLRSLTLTRIDPLEGGLQLVLEDLRLPSLRHIKLANAWSKESELLVQKLGPFVRDIEYGADD